jgi:hypothetical protein
MRKFIGIMTFILIGTAVFLTASLKAQSARDTSVPAEIPAMNSLNQDRSQHQGISPGNTMNSTLNSINTVSPHATMALNTT